MQVCEFEINFLCNIYYFQTLIAGALALVAAIVTAFYVWKSAHLPVISTRKGLVAANIRKVNFASHVLFSNLRILSKRAKQAQGTIRVHKAGNHSVNQNTKEKMYLRINSIVDDWEFMTLLPKEILDELIDLKRFLEDYNFDIGNAGGAFGDDNFGKHLLRTLDAAQNRCFELSNKINKLHK